MVNKNPPPDERVVYLALKNIFKGQAAQYRQQKIVSKVIRKHQKEDEVADLIRAHGLDIVCNSARTLLSDGIFESALKAKIRFPELFDLSPTQSAERDASEVEAARQEADAIECAVEGRWEEFEDAGPSSRPFRDIKGKQTLVPADQQPELPEDPAKAQSPSPFQTSITPLFPIYLPLPAQNRIMVQLQSLLELACYNYGKRAMPQTLKHYGWDCPQAVELNRWTMEFTRNPHPFPGAEGLKEPGEEFFRSIANIRHTAVHRVRVTAKGIEQFLLDAETLAMLLMDTNSINKIKKLRHNTMTTAEELQWNQQFLRSKLDETLRGIKAQREELNRMQSAAIAKMEEEDTEYQTLAMRSIEEAMASSESSFSTAIETSTAGRRDDSDDIYENDEVTYEAEDDDDARVLSADE